MAIIHRLTVLAFIDWLFVFHGRVDESNVEDDDFFGESFPLKNDRSDRNEEELDQNQCSTYQSKHEKFSSSI